MNMPATHIEPPTVLRPHQRKAIDLLRKSITTGHRRPILYACCSFGKTIVSAELANLTICKGGKILFLTHRRLLALQTQEKFEKYGLYASILMAGENTDWEAPVIIATVQTMSRRIRLNDKFVHPADLIIIDEAHLLMGDMTREIINCYPGKVVIGLTGSPARGDGFGLGAIYDDIVEAVSINELTDKGFLKPIRYFTAEVPSYDDIKVVNGDYDKAALEKKVNRAKLVGDIVGTWLEKAEYRQTIVFAVGVKHSMSLCKQFEQAGVPAYHLDAKSPHDERLEVLKRFEEGELKVLCNVGLFCLDDKTEILCSDGWRGVDDISKDDLVANWDYDGRVYFKCPKQVIKRSLYDDEHFSSLASKMSDIRVTSSHSMVYKTNCYSNNWKKKKAFELEGKRFMYPVCGNAEPVKSTYVSVGVITCDRNKAIVKNSYSLRKKGYSMEDSKRIAAEVYDKKAKLLTKKPEELSIEECIFIGLWVGDGSVQSLKRGGVEYKIHQTKRYPHIVKMIEFLIKKIGLDYNRRERRNIYLNGNKGYDLYSWSFPRGTGGYNQQRKGVFSIEPYLKKDGSELYRSFTRKQFIAFMHGLWLADGMHINQKTKTMNKTNKKLLDLLQSIAVVRGVSCSLHKHKEHKNKKNSQQWTLSYNIRKTSRNVSGKFRLEKDNSRTGNVWCVETDSGNIITRRNGKVCVTGNCEGFDCDSVDCIVVARPTKSLPLWIQMAGRGQRIYPGAENCILLDHGGNVERLGLLSDELSWSLDYKEKWKDIVKVKKKEKFSICRSCREVFTGLNKCPVCGTELKTFGRDVDSANGELKEVGKKRKKKKVVSMVEKRRYYGMLLWYVKSKGWRHGAAAHKYREKFGVWPKLGNVAPIEPDHAFLSYQKHLAIKFAKSRKQ